MNKIFELSTKQYEPISIGSSYLFEQHHAIVSFLKSKLDPSLLNRLASPKLIERAEMIEWYANTSNTFSTIDSFSDEQQIGIKQKYWELKFKINEIIQSLSITSKGTEANQWIEILNATFSENDNLLLSDGDDLFIIWGWKFNSGASNYLEPQFLPSANPVVDNLNINDQKIDSSDENATSILESTDSQNDTTLNDDPTEEPIEKNKDINVILTTTENTSTHNENNNINETEVIDKPEVDTIRKLTFWERIKRFFRWISYRFWALMLLIIFILLLCCLCKNCSTKKAAPCDNCKELDSINKRLEETKIRLKENCPPN